MSEFERSVSFKEFSEISHPQQEHSSHTFGIGTQL
jgi:hypothetical protein